MVIVTGASKGIGAAVARQFAAEGAHLHLVSRTAPDLELLQAELQRDYPAAQVAVHAIDLGAAGSVAALWAALDASELGPVDILVNNAGAIPAGDLLTVDEETWRSSWDLKVFGYINMAREAYRHFQTAGGGVILNVIGTGGVRPTFGYIAGATANAGLIAFTEALGAESAKDGIRVLGVRRLQLARGSSSSASAGLRRTVCVSCRSLTLRGTGKSRGDTNLPAHHAD